MNVSDCLCDGFYRSVMGLHFFAVVLFHTLCLSCASSLYVILSVVRFFLAA